MRCHREMERIQCPERCAEPFNPATCSCVVRAVDRQHAVKPCLLMVAKLSDRGTRGGSGQLPRAHLACENRREFKADQRRDRGLPRSSKQPLCALAKRLGQIVGGEDRGVDVMPQARSSLRLATTSALNDRPRTRMRARNAARFGNRLARSSNGTSAAAGRPRRCTRILSPRATRSSASLRTSAPLRVAVAGAAPFAARTPRLRLDYQPQYLTSCS